MCYININITLTPFQIGLLLFLAGVDFSKEVNHGIQSIRRTVQGLFKVRLK